MGFSQVVRDSKVICSKSPSVIIAYIVGRLNQSDLSANSDLWQNMDLYFLSPLVFDVSMHQEHSFKTSRHAYGGLQLYMETPSLHIMLQKFEIYLAEGSPSIYGSSVTVCFGAIACHLPILKR